MTKIYYRENGSKDEIATWINNNEWILPIFVVSAFVIAGIVEKLL